MRATHLRSAALVAAGLFHLAACDADEPDAVAARRSAVRSATALGVVTGGIYTAGPQSLASDGDRVFCEMSALGASWIRVQSHWPGVDAGAYQSIVRRAHASGLRVVVLVTDDYCGGDDDLAGIDAFAAQFEQRVREATAVFSGDAAPDAWEWINEPNNDGACPGRPAGTFRVGGNAFAWVLRRVWDARAALAVRAPVVSGGTLNSYFTESWWTAFLGSGAFRAGERPFDYFGVHPYDPYGYDGGGDFGAWAADMGGRLARLAQRVDDATGARGTRLFVTEFGWETDRAYSPGSNVAGSAEQAAAALDAAMGAFDASGVVEAALWYDYRDDAGGGGQHFGLRGVWNGAGYAPKDALLERFADRAGGSRASADSCWGAAGAPTSGSPPSESPAPPAPSNASCPCLPMRDNFCSYASGTPDCPMTQPGGYCDPNSDGSFMDGDWGRGFAEFAARCR